MIFLNADEVDQALPMAELIPAVKGAYTALTKGEVELPLRIQIPVTEEEGVALFMPAYLHQEDQKVITLKTVNVFPRNLLRNLPTIHAAVLVMNVETGQIEALLEGSRLTALRTGAASGVATDLLARPESRVGAVFGAGVQGRTQLLAICSVRQLDQVWIFDLDQQRVGQFIQEMAGVGPIPKDLKAASSPSQAVENADVICTATTTTRPVFSDQDLKPGVHINGVGSYTPAMIEVPPETVARSSVFVDSREAVIAEAGEIITAIQQGLINEGDLIEIGQVVTNHKAGRTRLEEITFFKSVGVAVQDAAAAWLALRNARKNKLGREIHWYK